MAPPAPGPASLDYSSDSVASAGDTMESCPHADRATRSEEQWGHDGIVSPNEERGRPEMACNLAAQVDIG